LLLKNIREFGIHTPALPVWVASTNLAITLQWFWTGRRFAGILFITGWLPAMWQFY